MHAPFILALSLTNGAQLGNCSEVVTVNEGMQTFQRTLFTPKEDMERTVREWFKGERKNIDDYQSKFYIDDEYKPTYLFIKNPYNDSERMFLKEDITFLYITEITGEQFNFDICFTDQAPHASALNPLDPQKYLVEILDAPLSNLEVESDLKDEEAVQDSGNEKNKGNSPLLWCFGILAALPVPVASYALWTHWQEVSHFLGQI